MKIKKLVLLLSVFILSSSIDALPLKETLKNTLLSNPEVKSLRHNTDAFKYYIDEAYGGYLPSISVDYYLENKNTSNENLNTDSTSKTKQNGYNATIKYEHTLFDGGLTPFKVSESKYNFEANKIKNISQVESLLFNTIDVYLETVKFKEFALLSKNNIKLHERYFEIAIESEKVSGEKLDRLQVESKLIGTKAKYIKEKRDAQEKYETFIKLTGDKSNSLICRPNADTKSLYLKKNLLQTALNSNYLILEELEKIKSQRALINQKRSSFLPTIKAKIQKEYDNDVDTEDFYKKELSAKITLSYNIFNGFKDRSAYLKEKKFLQEAQERMDNSVKIVTENFNTQKSIFDTSFERVEYLKKDVLVLKDILNITQEQFDGGTKTFIEVLSAIAVLNKAKKDLIEEEYLNLVTYYKLLNITSNLSENVFKSSSQVCSIINADLTKIEKTKSDEEEINELLEKEPISSEKEEKQINQKEQQKENEKKEIDKMLNDLLNEVYEIKSNRIDNMNSKLKSNNKNKEILISEKTKIVQKEEKAFKDIKAKENSIINKNNKKEYTITLLVTSNINRSLKVLKKRYKLSNEDLKYKAVESNENLIKVSYGTYNTFEKAIAGISNLHRDLQKSKPYVTLIRNN